MGGMYLFPSQLLPLPPNHNKKPSSRPKAAHSAAAAERPPHFSLALVFTCLFVCHPAGICFCFCRCLFLPFPPGPNRPGAPSIAHFAMGGMYLFPSQLLPLPPNHNKKPSSRPKAAHSAAAAERPPHFSLAVALFLPFALAFAFAVGVGAWASAPRKKPRRRRHRSAEGRNDQNIAAACYSPHPTAERAALWRDPHPLASPKILSSPKPTKPH